MKKLFIASLIATTSITNVFAGCEDGYSNYLKAANQREAARKEYNGKKEMYGLVGAGLGAYSGTMGASHALMSVASLAADTEGSLVSTAVVPFFAAGLFLGTVTSAKIADKYVEGDRSESEALNIYQLTNSLKLIKEAQAGQGTTLEAFMPLIWREVKSSVGLNDLAETISTLNSENAFCQKEDELDTSKGIIEKAIAVLKAEK